MADEMTLRDEVAAFLAALEKDHGWQTSQPLRWSHTIVGLGQPHIDSLLEKLAAVGLTDVDQRAGGRLFGNRMTFGNRTIDFEVTATEVAAYTAESLTARIQQLIEIAEGEGGRYEDYSAAPV
jgi:hypothetical protein